MRTRTWKSWLPIVIGIVVALGVAQQQRGAGGSIEWSPALDEQWVETEATVYRILPDDNHGSRHQRLLVHAPDGHSLLIAHNIDLAERVPVALGDALTIRGQFEWNDKGGVIHWTHHDPRGRHDGGWLRHKGATYR